MIVFLLQMAPKYEYAQYGVSCTSISEGGPVYMPSLKQTLHACAFVAAAVYGSAVHRPVLAALMDSQLFLSHSQFSSAQAKCTASIMLASRACCSVVQWLRDDLEAVDRCATPWLIVGMHRPMYVVFPHKSNRIVGSEFPRLG